MRWPSKSIALDAAKRNKPTKQKGLHRYVYVCAHCNKNHMGKDIQVDHIVPAGSLKSFEDLPGFVERLFCEPEQLQVLCKPCHQLKTNEERAASKALKKK